MATRETRRRPGMGSSWRVSDPVGQADRVPEWTLPFDLNAPPSVLEDLHRSQQVARRRTARGSEILDPAAAKRAEDRAQAEFEYWRKLSQLDLWERENALHHRAQMRVQAEWRGTIGIVRALLVVVVLGLVIALLATHGTVGLYLARFVLH